MRFTWYELKSTDPEAAASFYPAVAGWEAQRYEGGFLFHRQGELLAGLSLLPEPARARGAPANWLGLIAVPDVEAWAQRFIAAGAERLGPVRRDGTGEVAVLRAPQGEVIGLGSGARGPSRAVLWHELHTADAERAWSFYAGLLGWGSTEAPAPAADIGPYRTFSWQGAEGSAGGMSSLAQEPQIHPHWLYYFAVTDLDHALQRVGALGGQIADGPRVLAGAGGDRFAYCEDPQGAAFGLRECGPS